MWKKQPEGKGPESIETNEGYTFLAKGGAIEGIAKLEGVVRIDGHFSGSD